MCRLLTPVFLFSAIASMGTVSNQDIAHLGAANQFFEQERFEEAAREYQQVLDSHSGLLAARRDLAVCRFELRQYAPARELLSELLTHRSTNSLARYYLGRIDLAEGRFAGRCYTISLDFAGPPVSRRAVFSGLGLLQV